MKVLQCFAFLTPIYDALVIETSDDLTMIVNRLLNVEGNEFRIKDHRKKSFT